MVEKILSTTVPISEEEVVKTLPCIQDHPLYPIIKEKFLELQKEATAGIKEDVRYTKALSDNYRAIYFRKGSVIYIRIEKKEENGTEFHLYLNLFMDVAGNEQCFQVAPPQCKFEGESFEVFEKVCRGYMDWADDIKKSLIRVSVNGDFNPAGVADSFVECIRKTIVTHSIPMECAIKGIKMDRQWALEKLNEEAQKLRKKGMKVQIDTENLKLNYEEPEKVEVETIRKSEEEDLKVTGGAKPSPKGGINY